MQRQPQLYRKGTKLVRKHTHQYHDFEPKQPVGSDPYAAHGPSQESAYYQQQQQQRYPPASASQEQHLPYSYTQQEYADAYAAMPPRLFTSGADASDKPSIPRTPWTVFSRIVTCWFPSGLMKSLFGGQFEDKLVRQAWREKVALCFLILVLSAVVAFITLGLDKVLCGANVTLNQQTYKTKRSDCPERLRALPDSLNNQDVYSWERLPSSSVFVLDGVVINADSYITTFADPALQVEDPLDATLRRAIADAKKGRKDATRLFVKNPEAQKYALCVKAKYKLGIVDVQTPTCFLNFLIMTSMLIVVASITLIKFVLAALYYHVTGRRLASQPSIQKALHVSRKKVEELSETTDLLEHDELAIRALPGQLNTEFCKPHVADIVDFRTVLLVTCYSEGEESLRVTLDSLASTTYRDDRKLLFIVADGIVTGSGNAKSTPDLLLDMLDIGEAKAAGFGPRVCTYTSVGVGDKSVNNAAVYAGWYECQGHRVPTVLVVKCGTELEKDAPKPGNRGKRDSQLVLMNFFSRCLFYDRMSELDYDLFQKIRWLTGVTSDQYEIVLMVDADTKVAPDSLTKLLNSMHNDPEVMGVCGETRIANKTDGFVTAIQVFEYFISHHLGKAFESMFGGVTCLPGCFCMWRLKARPRFGDWNRMGSDSDVWVPLLTSQEIIEEYDQSTVNTLHEKNLLLLGEDRFLTTLMLRRFFGRKVMFVEDAICHTVVPDTFKVLRSQRRRWINSTVHNLMELVRVPHLCGTFCFSMQFVVFVELLGTALLPIATILLVVLLVQLAFVDYSTVRLMDMVPLMLLVLSFILPVVLVLITTRKITYIGWMLIYLLALPIWQLVLPVYAFWHFDDFSWGETRKVSGPADHGSDPHSGGSSAGTLLTVQPPLLRLFHEWEVDRRAREQRARYQSQYQQRQQQNSWIPTPPPPVARFRSTHPSPEHYY